MLSDDELAAARDIERRLRWDSPELARLFDGMNPRPKKSPRKRAQARMLVAALAFAGLALLGPRMLNEVEIKIQKSPPLPRTSPLTNVARPESAVSGPAAVATSSTAIVNLLLAPSTTVATAS